MKHGGFDAAVAAELRRLFELRNAADYSWLDALEPSDDDPLAAADRFVGAVERWIANRPPG